jgi:hypothetical protein
MDGEGMDNIEFRFMTHDDLGIWLSFAHDTSDNIIKELTPDIEAFYEGFDKYMESKITKQEAYMAIDRFSKNCVGIVAFSQSNNRITFLGISGSVDFEFVGTRLMDIAFEKLDSSKEISANVLIGDYESLRQEKRLYEKYGFIASNDYTFEANVPAYLLKRYPTKQI